MTVNDWDVFQLTVKHITHSLGLLPNTALRRAFVWRLKQFVDELAGLWLV